MRPAVLRSRVNEFQASLQEQPRRAITFLCFFCQQSPVSFLQPEMSSSASNKENNASVVASDAASDDPRRLLWVAAQEGRTTDLRALLQVALATGGVHVAADVLPALRVAACNDHAAVVLALLGTGAAGVDDQTDACPSPLWAASFYGSTDAALVLVQAKVDIDKATANYGRTPAFAAAWNGHTDSLQLLVHAKADIDKVTTDCGETPALVAALSGHTYSLQVLVHAKADIDKARTDHGTTPAFIAAENGDTDSLQVLVHAKADIDKARTDCGATPAFIAAQNMHTNSLQVLVQAAADVTRCLDGNGWCPLLVASGNGHLEVVRLLMDRAPQMFHVRTTAKHRRWGQCIAAGSAPVDVARQLQRDRVVQLLAGEIASTGGQPKSLRK